LRALLCEDEEDKIVDDSFYMDDDWRCWAITIKILREQKTSPHAAIVMTVNVASTRP
jgi:hypothetical protein